MRRRHALLALASSLLPLQRALAALPPDKGLVGLSMPTMASLRWVYDGLGMMRALDKLGYSSDLQYANDNVALQVGQIEAMLQKNAKVLVIAAVDGSSLTGVLDRAGKQGVKVVAYDRLIRGTAYVDSYATFDNFQVGVLQAQDIESRLQLKGNTSRHFHIELFAGSADDNNTRFFFDGAMSVLLPYIQSGVLTVGSGKTALNDVTTAHWSGALAKARMQAMLGSVYAKKRVDAVLSPYDGISIEILNALKGAGYGQPAQPWPVVTGQDAELASVRSIQREEQSSTVFKDTRELARFTASMVDDIVSGRKPAINDEKTYHNGVKIVPSTLLKPVRVDRANWRAVLLDSGYYKPGQV
jgi:putative multiple sugar transport system substrate-binding protein